MRAILLAAAVVLAGGSPALAQPVSSLADLALHINLDETVIVTARDGRTWEGRVVDLPPRALVLNVWRVDTTRQVRLPAESILEVAHHAKDPLNNGAWIGCGVLGGLAIAIELLKHGSSGFVVECLLGAGIGATIDSVIRRREVVFRADGHLVAVRPTFTGRFAGLAIRW